MNQSNDKAAGCELTDHVISWGGDGYYCVRCMTPFVSSGFPTPRTGNKCVASNIQLMSNPPQSKCKYCGQTWFVRYERPICHTKSPIDSEWKRCSECQFELRPNAPFYGGHQKDCSFALDKPSTVEVGHADSDDVAEKVIARFDVTEDDAIEEILKEFVNILGDSPIKYAWADWLRNALRSYGDMRSRKTDMCHYCDANEFHWKEEGRREERERLLNQKANQHDQEVRKAVLDELDKKFNSLLANYSADRPVPPAQVRVIIEDMRK